MTNSRGLNSRKAKLMKIVGEPGDVLFAPVKGDEFYGSLVFASRESDGTLTPRQACAKYQDFRDGRSLGWYAVTKKGSPLRIFSRRIDDVDPSTRSISLMGEFPIDLGNNNLNRVHGIY